MSKSALYVASYKRPAVKAVLEKYSAVVSGIHPECQRISRIGARDFDALVESIDKHGLVDPIVLDKSGKLIDGRSRLSALYVLGLSLEDSDVRQAEFTAKVIAETNVARRHLRLDQKIMLAAEKLVRERKKAHVRKLEGGKKGRTQRKKSLVANSATSKEKPPRRPATLDVVAKSEEVPRGKLRIAEILLKDHPKVAKQIKDGQLSIAKAMQQTGLDKKPSKTATPEEVLRVKAKAKQELDEVKRFSDARTNIVDQPAGFRVVTCGDVLIYIGKKKQQTVLVYFSGFDWHVRASGEAKSYRAKTKQEAIAEATKRLAKQTE